MYDEAGFYLIFASEEKSAEIMGPVILKGHHKWKRYLHYNEVTLFYYVSATLNEAQRVSALPAYIKFFKINIENII